MAKKGNKNGKDKGKAIQPVRMSGKEIEERLLEAESEEELKTIHNVLKLEGVPDGSITAIISKLRSKGQLIFTTAVTHYGEGTKPLAVESIIRSMKLPEMVLDGGKEIFDAGVKYGMSALVAGVRLAQELSQMGISQASPVIRMAQELRAAAGESAREAGQVAAENALAGAIEYLSSQPKQTGKVDIATVPNPLAGIFARALEPAMTQAFSGLFSAFGLGGGQPTKEGSQINQPIEQAKQRLSLPSSWTIGKEKEDKEEKD